jgi:hypothetical protein
MEQVMKPVMKAVKLILLDFCGIQTDVFWLLVTDFAILYTCQRHKIKSQNKKK